MRSLSLNHIGRHSLPYGFLIFPLVFDRVADGDELFPVGFIDGSIVGDIHFEGDDAVLGVDLPEVRDHIVIGFLRAVGTGPSAAEMGEQMPLHT